MEQPFIHSITEHQRIIHKVCRIYRDTPEDREDLFQEIVYQLWKSFPSFRRRSSVATWMYRIALSTAMAKYRRKQLPQGTPLDSIEAAASPTPATHPKQDDLYRAIATLSAAEKAIIALYLDDYRYEEIAEITGISASYVGVRLNRIKQKLTHQLNPDKHDR